MQYRGAATFRKLDGVFDSNVMSYKEEIKP